MRAILLDIDGVLLQQNGAIPGAADTLNWLTQQGIPWRCITNTTSRPAGAIAAQCQAAGLSVADTQIFNPVRTAVRWLRQQGISRLHLLVAADIRADFSEFDLHSTDPQAIVIGDIGQAFSMSTLNPVFRLLMDNPQRPLLALGMTRYFAAADGLQLDVGPFVKALEYASGRPALVMGKPDKTVFELALADMGVVAADAVMLGDDRYSDVLAAQALGITGILVQTGKYRPGDEHANADGERPDHCLASVAALPQWLAG